MEKKFLVSPHNEEEEALKAQILIKIGKVHLGGLQR